MAYSMNCIICNRDTGDGTHKAIILETRGNYGSEILDNDGIITFSICDRCLVDRRSRCRQVVKLRCTTCDSHTKHELIPVEPEVIALTFCQLCDEPLSTKICYVCAKYA